ncbi:hypothetical protein EVAR_86029_1 [Eumeta japonica]|uniref:Uncharacterized protein n=1 Tax=Eumeta variegata TaxID=151549 RepID=A0A4C1UKA8_EUMVA|nr:hypothetical protein EVAR_86029_1 [Eumeta japonica]
MSRGAVPGGASVRSERGRPEDVPDLRDRRGRGPHRARMYFGLSLYNTLVHNSLVSHLHKQSFASAPSKLNRTSASPRIVTNRECPWATMTIYTLVAPQESWVPMGCDDHLYSGGSSRVVSVHKPR